jgi:hypothetical protein
VVPPADPTMLQRLEVRVQDARGLNTEGVQDDVTALYLGKTSRPSSLP